MRFRPFLLLTLAGCQWSPALDAGFGSLPEVMTVGEATGTSTGSTGGSSTTGTTGGEGGSSSEASETMAEPARDLGGMPDFGDGPPVGCKGKIDLLFVISRYPSMTYMQAKLAAAFPQFISTIKSKFAEFDYHIMVIAGDDEWGNELCTELCPAVNCMVGEPCCDWYDPGRVGEACCDLEYPCQDLDQVTQCDRTWGAGEVFPAGPDGEANKPCAIDGGLRYLVKGQTNLEETFECISMVGSSGWGSLAQALVAALEKPINQPGGCNRGFLRKDALLMVTFISGTVDDKNSNSKGTPAEWAKAVIDAKHGDDRSVVMLSIFNTEAQYEPLDRIGMLVKMFPYHHIEDSLAPDYGPAFIKATSLVDTACSEFVPPG